MGRVWHCLLPFRAAKRERLRSEGWEPYLVQLPITTTIAAVRERYSHLEAGQETEDIVGVAERVVFLRNIGRLCFVERARQTAARKTAAIRSAKLRRALLAGPAAPAKTRSCIRAAMP